MKYKYCRHNYLLDYPRNELCKIDKIKILSKEQKDLLKEGKQVSVKVCDRWEYYFPVNEVDEDAI